MKKGKVFWFTGLSGAGKTTLAQAVSLRLEKEKQLTFCLDGDEIRRTINRDLGYTEADRRENVRRAAEIASWLIQKEVIVLSAFMSPTREMRSMAKEIIGEENFFEIFIDTPISLCQKRDVKGLYAKFERGEIANISGLDAPFEPPISPFLKIDTSKLSIEEAAALIFSQI